MSHQTVGQRKTTRTVRTREHGGYRPTSEKESNVKFHLSVSDHRFAVKNPTRYVPDVLGKIVT